MGHPPLLPPIEACPRGVSHFPLLKNQSLTFKKPLTHFDTPRGGLPKTTFPAKKFLRLKRQNSRHFPGKTVKKASKNIGAFGGKFARTKKKYGSET